VAFHYASFFYLYSIHHVHMQVHNVADIQMDTALVTHSHYLALQPSVVVE